MKNNLTRGRKPADHSGTRFGRWTAMSRVHNKNGTTSWVCKCDCGTERIVRTCHLVSGRSFSCGCFREDIASSTFTTHGLTNSSEYKIWLSIKNRCENENANSYADYGGRGIKVCERWGDFKAFFEDVGTRPSKKHSMGRINNDGDYCPENCRWETPKQQANNTRRNKYIEINGVKKTLKQACEDIGLNYGTVKWRLRNGGSVEDALK